MDIHNFSEGQEFILRAVGILAALAIFIKSEPVINRMVGENRPFIRTAFLLLASGAAFLALKIYQGFAPPPSVLLILGGAAMLLIGERRWKVGINPFVPRFAERRKNRVNDK